MSLLTLLLALIAHAVAGPPSPFYAADPSGTRIAFSDHDGTVRVWDRRGAEEVGVFRGPTGVRRMLWRGDRIVVASAFETWLIDTAGGPTVHVTTGDVLDASADGRLIATRTQLLDLERRMRLLDWPAAEQVRFSWDGSTVAVTGPEGTVFHPVPR